MRISTFFAITMLAACTGGPNPNCEGPDCDPVVCDDCDPTTCDDCTAGEKARISIQPTFVGENVDCAIKVGDVTGMSGDVLEVNAGTYTPEIGGDPPTEDGLPTHALSADIVLVASHKDDPSINLQPGDDKSVEAKMNQYVYIENAVCVNTAGPGGDFYPGKVYVEDGYKIVGMEEKYGDESWLEVEGDHLVLQGWEADSFGVSIIASNVNVNSFEFTTQRNDISATFLCRER